MRNQRQGPDRRKRKSQLARRSIVTPGTSLRYEDVLRADEILDVDDITFLKDILFIRIFSMPALVQSYAQENRIEQQYDVIEYCLKRLLRYGKSGSLLCPHSEQIRILRRLIYGHGDTLLIARTGFGKSLILHAYSILTGQITIQLVPLNGLGDQQKKDIAKIPGINPCLVTSDTKRDNFDLLKEIEEASYTHILLSSEQALFKEFKHILLNADLQAKIGLVAIDECHLIKQWENFRGKFAMLDQLRMLLRQNILWFGCSATLSEKDEKVVLETGGFRGLGTQPWETGVIRTFIDRPDVFISVHSVPRGKLNIYELLFFLLDDAVDIEAKATPQKISKTIVFIDSIVKSHKAVMYFRNILLELSKESSAKTYSRNITNKTYDVNEIVQIYNSRVSEEDQTKRFAEFMKPTSNIRIMVATTSMGMGVNVPDVKRTVLWRFPVSRDIADVWQRMGRGGREENQISHAFLFLEYWAFDSEGRIKANAQDSQVEDQAESQIEDCLSEAESVIFVRFNQSQSQSQFRFCNQSQSQATTTKTKLKTWTTADLKKRNELSMAWRNIVNGFCHRIGFLSYLGEDKLTADVEKTIISKENCCSRCNPERIPAFTLFSDTISIKRSRAGSRSALLWTKLKNWCRKQAETLYPSSTRRFLIPAAIFMTTKCQWQLTALFDTSTSFFGANWAELRDRVSLLSKWEYQEKHGEDLYVFLKDQIESVNMAYNKQQEYKKQERARKATKEIVSSQTGVFNPRVETLKLAARKKEDDLARAAIQRTNLLKNQSISEPAASVAEAELTALRANAALSSALVSSPAPSTPQKESSISPSIFSMPVESNSSCSSRKRKSSLLEKSSSKQKRRPLKELSINRGVQFRGVSQFGRIRKPTGRGLDNFSTGENAGE